MDKGKATLGIYGIPDRNALAFPEESHDHGIVLMDKGRILKSLQLERKTRKKHDHRLSEYLFDLIKEEGLLAGDYDIAFSNNVLGNSMISSNGKIRLEGPLYDKPATVPLKAHAWWLDQAREAWLVNHELAHVYSAMPFYGKFPNNSLLVHFDGGASKSNFSAFSFKNEKLDFIEAHWDLKYLSAFFNANALCFGIIGVKKKEQLAVPGKLMGLAAFGSWSDEMENWLRRNEWFSNVWGSKSGFFKSAEQEFGWSKKQIDSRDPFLQNIVATMHEVFVRESIQKIRSLAEENDLNNLIFTGGSALNIVLNARLLRMDLFDQLWIPPCTNDSGLALGASSCLEYLKHGDIEIHSPYIENWSKTESDTIEIGAEDIQRTAESIDRGEVVGICNGYGESGPRALGNRSLVSRADSPELARKLSMEIKGREWYRPLAPVMRKNQLKKYTGENESSPLGRFMLDEFKIMKSEKDKISGAMHVDGTARIQYLNSREDNPFLWDLLVYLEEKHGIDCLINTSFNKRGEPIVDTVADARESALKMGIRQLVIKGKYVIL